MPMSMSTLRLLVCLRAVVTRHRSAIAVDSYVLSVNNVSVSMSWPQPSSFPQALFNGACALQNCGAKGIGPLHPPSESK